MIKSIFLLYLYLSIGFYNNHYFDFLQQEKQFLLSSGINSNLSIVYCTVNNIEEDIKRYNKLLNKTDKINYNLILDVPRYMYYERIFYIISGFGKRAILSKNMKYEIKKDSLIGKYAHFYSKTENKITIKTRKHYALNEYSNFTVFNIIFRYKNNLQIKINYNNGYNDTFYVFYFENKRKNFNFDSLYEINAIHSTKIPLENKWNIFQFNMKKIDNSFNYIKSIEIIGKNFDLANIAGRFEKETIINNIVYYVKTISEKEHKSLKGWYLVDELPNVESTMGCVYKGNYLKSTGIKNDETMYYIIKSIADSLKDSLLIPDLYVLMSTNFIDKNGSKQFAFNKYLDINAKYIFDFYPIVKNNFDKDLYFEILNAIHETGKPFSFVIQGFDNTYYTAPNYENIKILFYLPIIMGAENIFIYRFYERKNKKIHNEILKNFSNFFENNKDIINIVLNSKSKYIKNKYITGRNFLKHNHLLIYKNNKIEWIEYFRYKSKIIQ